MGGTKQDLADHLGYVKDLRAGVKAELAKGSNPFALGGILKLDKYKDWAGYEGQFPLNVIHVAVEEALLGPYARPVPLNKKTPSGQDLPTLPNGISNLDFSWRRVGGGIPLKLITYLFIKRKGQILLKGFCNTFLKYINLFEITILNLADYAGLRLSLWEVFLKHNMKVWNLCKGGGVVKPQFQTFLASLSLNPSSILR